jgi:hypothetical protein
MSLLVRKLSEREMYLPRCRTEACPLEVVVAECGYVSVLPRNVMTMQLAYIC